MLPINVTPTFAQRLRDPEPICLVGDTNALYHGTLAHCLALRGSLATHVALADQALMELQKQRETAHAPQKSAAAEAKPTAIESWYRGARRSTFIAAGGRAVRRLRDSGHIVHVARPPAAMVRYFGGGPRAGEDQREEHGSTDVVGSNALRDRLILEAAIQQRIHLPGVQVWLVTSDALLAAQAELEGLNVGFCWLPEKLHPRMLTSPFIEARTLRLRHVAVAEFLEESLWSSSNLRLQREDESKALFGKVPPDKRDFVLCAMRERDAATLWSEEAGSPWTRETEIPKKAPPPQNLVSFLVSALGKIDLAKLDDASRLSVAYLRALGWMEHDSGALTSKGTDLAKRWSTMKGTSVQGWAQWIADAARDVRRLGPIKSAIGTLESHRGAKDADLAERLGVTKRNVESQMLFASVFGVTIRFGEPTRKNCVAEFWEDEAAEKAILDAIPRIIAESPGSDAAAVSRLFTFFTRPDNKPMPFHTFRAALGRLDDAGRVMFSGSVPLEDIVLRTIEPDAAPHSVAVRDVNLGDGSFLLPGKAAKVVQLRQEAH